MYDEDRYHMLDSYGNELEFTEEQKRCIDYDGRSVLVIKGTAGSGKSMMVIKRAMEYRNDIIERGSREKVGIFVFNTTLSEGIKHILGVNNVDINDSILSVDNVDHYLASLCKRYNVIPKNTDEPFEYKDNWTRRHERYDRYAKKENDLSEEVRLGLVKEVMEKLASEHDHPYYHRNPQLWADEIQWMYQNGIVDDDDLNKYLDMPRDGRCKNYNVHLNREGRKVVFKIFVNYNRAIVKKNLIEWDRMYALLYRNHMDEIDSSYKFDYMIVDEAQDLSLTKMRIICELCTGELGIAMDKNQSLYGHRWSFKRDLNFQPHVKKLTIAHRGTHEIDEFSKDLKVIDDTLLEQEDRYENEMSMRNGVKPKVVRCSSPDAEMEFIINEATSLVEQGANVAILCLDYKHLYAFRDQFRRRGIRFQFFRDPEYSALTPGIKLSTVHSAKGLGFVHVIMPNFEEDIYPKSVENIISTIANSPYPEDEVDLDDAIAEEISGSRRLAYVGITRAMGDVYLTYSGVPSRFLREFKPEHYDLIDESYREVTDSRIIEGSEHVRHSMIGSGFSEDQGIDGVPADAAETMGGSSPAASEASSGEDDVISILDAAGVEYIDRRPKSVLWIIDEPGIEPVIRQLKSMGYVIGYAEHSSRVIGNRPAYYLGE